MKRLGCIGALIVVALTWTAAQADFYVVAVPGRVGTEISSLPCTISSAGFYYLSKNLTSTSRGITVEANDVTIDLMGFCITGPGHGSSTIYHGVELPGARNNLEVRNGSIKSFGGGGVTSSDTSNSVRVLGLRVSDTSYGINLNGDNDTVPNCSAFANNKGITVNSGSLVKGNHVYNNTGRGISADWANMIIGNTVQHNSGGIYISSSSSVIDNLIFTNTNSGIYGFSYNNISRNTTMGNGASGIEVMTYCTIIHNNTDSLIYGANCTVVDNTVH